MKEVQPFGLEPSRGKPQDERLRIEERITRKRDFDRLFKIGKQKKTKLFTLIYVPCDERRIGIVLSHHIKGAVVRNKLKRRLRDIYRKNKDRFKGECIIVAYPGAESITYSGLQEEILKLSHAI